MKQFYTKSVHAHTTLSPEILILWAPFRQAAMFIVDSVLKITSYVMLDLTGCGEIKGIP